MIKNTIEELIKSSVMGFAVGDALGVPVEFLNRNKLKKKPITEMEGFGSYSVPAGTWSDDTSMMLATMDSIIDNNLVIFDDIMFRFNEWTTKAKYTATDKLFGIGIATNKAINNYRDGKIPIECGMTGVYENGNGSLMRILPIVYYSYINELSENDEVDLINKASSLTHRHEISRLGCKIYSDFIKNLLNGMNRIEAFNDLKKRVYDKFYSSDSIKYYERILSGELCDVSEDKIKSSGFVVDTLEACLWCTINSNSYEDAVIKAVNLGEDTDTVGAITGSINGIIYGYDSIPKRWTYMLQKKEYVDKMADAFSNSLLKKR